MAFDAKAATPDTTIPSGAFLLGADSQSAGSPSVYAIDTTIMDYIRAKSITWTGAQTFSGGITGASNILEQRNGVNAQTTRIYKTYTDASNYEGIRITGAGLFSAPQIETIAAGTGTLRSLYLGCGNDNPSWYISTTNGHFLAVNDGLSNIGAASANRVLAGYATSGWLVTGTGTVGIGYGTGAGGSVTQASSRTTGVTLNTLAGAITLVSAAGSTTPATFTVTNSAVAATDTIILSQKSGTDLYDLKVTSVASGSFNITFNTTGGTTSEQPVINFAVIKAVAA